ncbi:VirD4-like conjugal transfer protein, CD1115 family [Scatolibacter rhodanostii]|uniref:VirD4-like conjugal transfer protein, CD1115 family n=1 Tax=Scatolibacter rhodanostii TaxID=2014781 RepID=UPI000C073876|nr:type IV secretory system conjugative DNA transfer family protein [Scatolibacter rhodanostii]
MENVRILSKDVCVNNDTWATGLNNNDMIIGGSGAGKTRGYVLPNILQGNESMIIADTKGSVQGQVEQALLANGYKIMNIDFRDLKQSYGYNPLDYVRYDKEKDQYSEQDIMTIASCLVPIEAVNDPFWELSARIYIESMIAYVFECLPENEHNLVSVVQLFHEMNTGRFNSLFEELKQQAPQSFALNRYNMYQGTQKSEKTYESVRAFVGKNLSVMCLESTQAIFKNPQKIRFEDLGKEKTAVFLSVSDTDRSMDKLANLFYTQALHALCGSADRDYTDFRLPIPVRFILDDFAANVFIPDFDKIISIIRSREISVSVILQSISQLEGMYGHAGAMTILNNCDHCLYLGGQDVETARYISVKANKSATSILNMPLNDAWLFTRGSEPKQVAKYVLTA